MTPIPPISQLFSEFPFIRSLEARRVGRVIPTLAWQCEAPWKEKVVALETIEAKNWVVFVIAFRRFEKLRLTSLKIADYLIPCSEWALVLGASPALTKLELQNCYDVDLTPILGAAGQTCLQLQELHLSKVSHGNTIDFSLLGKCTDLNTLSLVSCMGPLKKKLSGWLEQAGRKLSSLSLVDCSDVTEETLRMLPPSLSKLVISQCSRLQGSCLSSLRGLRLTSLYLNKTHTELSDFRKNRDVISELKELSLIESSVTSEICDEIAKTCRNLSRLYLGGHPNISLLSLKNLIACLPKLRFLDITGCGHDLVELQRINPQLKVFSFPE